MTAQRKIQISKFLSLVLRHDPGKIGLRLDENGWAQVDELQQRAAAAGIEFSFSELEDIVATNDKQRFAFDKSRTKIRASQGHSIEVNLELVQREPPALLYHGTVASFLPQIKAEGLQRMSRQYVHLSELRETAEKVGSRRGKPVILSIRSGDMYRDGYAFYLSENGVWLTDHVPAQYIHL